MMFSRYRAIVIGAALLLPACSFTEEALWPSLTGEDPAGAAASQTAQAPARPAAQPARQPAPAPRAAQPRGAGAPPPPLGGSDFTPSGVSPGSPTGTFVGKKVVELRGELSRLQGAISQHNTLLQQLRARMVKDSQGYHGTVAAINSRLQVGTTPGNPILIQQFNTAQSNLDRISADTSDMSKLATAVTGDSTMSAFLAESTRAAFQVSGALDEDHQQLAILEDEVNRTVVLIERLLKEVIDDIRRQTTYVGTERANLQLLSAGIKGGEFYGAPLADRALVSLASPGGVPVRSADTTGRRPLVVIRFDRPNVPYQQALYAAVSRVLERRPDAIFDLVAVAPASGGPARVALNSNKSRRYAENVLRSLVEMGLPPGRVAVSGKTSPAARTNEVHLYLR